MSQKCFLLATGVDRGTTLPLRLRKPPTLPAHCGFVCCPLMSLQLHGAFLANPPSVPLAPPRAPIRW